jgi:hypothetical protein
MTLIDEILKERKYQDEKWGTEFDDKNTLNDWAAYIGRYTGNAISIDSPPKTQRKQLLKVATIAVAAVQAFDRNGGFPSRHYEDRVPADES